MCLPGATLRSLREIRPTIFFSGSISPILGRDDCGTGEAQPGGSKRDQGQSRCGRAGPFVTPEGC